MKFYRLINIRIITYTIILFVWIDSNFVFQHFYVEISWKFIIKILIYLALLFLLILYLIINYFLIIYVTYLEI